MSGVSLSHAREDQPFARRELWYIAADPVFPPSASKPLTPGIGAAFSVAFSPVGHMLVTGNNDATVRLWDIADLEHPRPLGQPLTGGVQAVYSVVFSPNGQTLADGGIDGAIRLWNPTVTYATDWICSTAGNLTPQQWHTNIQQLSYQSLCAN